VLYVLHGASGGPADIFRKGGLGRLLDEFFARGNPPFVLVAPDGNGANHSDTEWADAVAGNDQIESFVTGNVISTVEGVNRRDLEHRAIAGFSMGGFGAMNLGLRHPDLYGSIVSMAGYFHVDDPSGMFGTDLSALRANTPELHVSAARGRRVFIVDGNRDDNRIVKGQSQQFAGKLIAANAQVWFEETTGTHNWGFVKTAFPDVERFLDARWAVLRPKGARLPRTAIASVSGHWRGRAGTATVDVVLPAAPVDPMAASIEQLRDDTGEPDLTYVEVTITNPERAPGPVSIAKVSFLTRRGVTITANEPHAFLAGLQEAATSPAVVKALQRIVATLAPAAVAPGHTETFTYVTTTLLPNVRSVFVGTSFGSEPLSLVKTPRARRSLPARSP
jgi:predicted esterase